MDLLHFSTSVNKFTLAIIFTTLNFLSCLYILVHFTLLPVKSMQVSLLSVCELWEPAADLLNVGGSWFWDLAELEPLP